MESSEASLALIAGRLRSTFQKLCDTAARPSGAAHAYSERTNIDMAAFHEPSRTPIFFEVLIGQVGQCRNADPIFGKALRVLPETELSSQSATCCIEAAPQIVGLHPPASARLPDKSPAQ